MIKPRVKVDPVPLKDFFDRMLQRHRDWWGELFPALREAVLSDVENKCKERRQVRR